MKWGFLFLVSIFFTKYTFSQVSGIVYGKENDDKYVMPWVQIKALHSKRSAVTADDGTFVIDLSNQYPDTLIFSFMGYYNDTLIVTEQISKVYLEITLYSEKILSEVVIEAKRKDFGILKMKTLNVEVIGEGEIRKAACCNLSESFQTNTSVDVNITDAVSGAKKIQMMGLDGVYTQIQFENTPYLRGLESSFGLSSIPGTWIESIQITKGTGSVVNGHESMAGLINLEYKKPDKMEKFYFNLYANQFGRTELNLDGSYKMKSKLTGAYFVHGATFDKEIDQNNDGFRDINLSKNVSVLNRWKYQGEKMIAHFGVNTYYQGKTGGQLGYLANIPSDLFGVNIESKHIDAFAKTGFLFKNRPTRSLGVIYNLKYHETDALFGVRLFSGVEKRIYVNSIYEDQIKNPNHTIKTGFSFVYSDLIQQLDSVNTTSLLNIQRMELIPGHFIEYTLHKTRLTAVFGNRIDYHSMYGLQISPRFYGKYIVNDKIDLRFTGGRGFRTPNVLIDNISLLASSRSWNVENAMEPEISWNYGASVSYDFFIQKRKNTLTVDFYRTQFVRQLIVDRDVSYDVIYFRNMEGKSFSNTLQAELNLALTKQFDFRFTYKMLDVQAPYNGKIVQQMMVPKHRWLTHLSFISQNKKWEANVTGVLNGKMRMKMFSSTYGAKVFDSETEIYPTVNAQITYVYKKWDFYLGGENLTNYRLKNVIVDAQNPFGNYFDATMVWAPITGVLVYGGLRYKLKQKITK